MQNSSSSARSAKTYKRKKSANCKLSKRVDWIPLFIYLFIFYIYCVILFFRWVKARQGGHMNLYSMGLTDVEDKNQSPPFPPKYMCSRRMFRTSCLLINSMLFPFFKYFYCLYIYIYMNNLLVFFLILGFLNGWWFF